MKKSILVLTFVLLGTFAAWAEDAKPDAEGNSSTEATDTWKKQVLANLNLNQAAFNNWQQGGTDFISWQAGINCKLENDTTAINWLNTLKMEYGLTYVNDQGTRKSSDGIDLESVYSWKTWPQVNPFVSLSAKTQFDAGFDYTKTPAIQTSAFLDPGYFTESAGLKYVPSEVFNTRLGLAVKETVASQFTAIYTVNPDTGAVQTELTEIGLVSVSELNLKLSSDSHFSSKLDLFWNGKTLSKTVAEWDNLLTVSLNKIINVNIEDDLRYEEKIYAGWQMKETLGIGVAFSLL